MEDEGLLSAHEVALQDHSPPEDSSSFLMSPTVCSALRRGELWATEGSESATWRCLRDRLPDLDSGLDNSEGRGDSMDEQGG